MADDADVPPLEDMTELLEQVQNIREQQNKVTKEQVLVPPAVNPGIVRAVKPEVKTNPGGGTVSQSKPDAKAKPSQQKDSGLFGGMKKGFLFGGKPQKSAAKPAEVSPLSQAAAVSAVPSQDDIPFIRPQQNASKDSSLKFDEVQQSMNSASQLLSDTKAWMTDDLLERVAGNKVLSECLQDPVCLQALTEFQQNPAAARERYQGNLKVQSFFKEFCQLMGGGVSIHEGGGADIVVHDPQAAEDQAKVQAILANPETRALLQDREVLELFQKLHQHPELGSRLLYEASPQLRGKIQRLKEVGLLDVQASS